MNDKERIAKAMGWRFISEDTTPEQPCCIKKRTTNFWYSPTGERFRNDKNLELPNPFTDANDDYVVLEWMRKDNRQFDDSYGGSILWETALAAIWEGRSESYCPYKIGDYARAALKVIDTSLQRVS